MWAAAPTSPLIGVGRTAYDPQNEGSLSDGCDDLVREAGEVVEELGTLALQPRDVIQVLVETTGPLVQLARLQDLCVIDAGDGGSDEVTEVGVALPFDRSFGNPLHDRGGMLDPHFLRALVLVRSSDAAGVEQEHLQRMLVEQFEEAVALQVVRHREERVRAGDTECL